MRIVAAFARPEPATKRARREQHAAGLGTLVGVEHDVQKEPYCYRVVTFDLNDTRDRARLTPIGVDRTPLVCMVMYARRLDLIITRPKPRDMIGEYKAKRAAAARRRRAARAAA